MLSAIASVKGSLSALAQSLPNELAGCERGLWAGVIQARFDELCSAFAGKVGPDEPDSG
jgi:hypothetical protein